VKLGMLARSEHRGLGNMSREFYRHMRPDKTLLVIPDAVRHAHLTSHVDWYPAATNIRFDGHLDEKVCREWLDGLDVVYTCETYYDWAFCRWAREQGVATICHVMPEWMRPEWAAEPSAWWAPTSWRLDLLPEGTRLVPVPIATDRFEPPAERDPGPLRWLHIAGAKTHADRNGTQSVIIVGRMLDPDQTVTIHTQSPGYAPLSPNVTINDRVVDDYSDLYRGFDALVMPRRYAGLCLPVLEAFAAGLPVLMTDMSPQNADWPVDTVATTAGEPVRMMGGRIPTGNVDVHALAEKMNRWASAPSEVAHWRARAARYVASNSWDVRAPEIRAELELVADLVAA
jgi:glycosyltransferase involved in cell wall biosynthesis